MTLVKNTLILSLLLTFVLTQPCQAQRPVQANTNDTLFRDIGLNEALTLASQKKKNLLIYFAAHWSGRCKNMERNVFSEDTIQMMLTDSYIALKVDVDTTIGQQLEDQFKVASYPTLLILDAQRNILKRSNGALRKKDFLKFIVM
jgi:thiol:disulfide interchange protein